MELFLPFPVIRSKNFFNKSIPIWSNDSQMVFRNRKWNYLNRKWNYFSPFQSSDQKTSLTNVSPFGPTSPKWFLVHSVCQNKRKEILPRQKSYSFQESLLLLLLPTKFKVNQSRSLGRSKLIFAQFFNQPWHM